MIRRPPRSTQSRSSAASDVYKRQGTFRADLLPHHQPQPGRSHGSPALFGIRCSLAEGGTFAVLPPTETSALLMLSWDCLLYTSDAADDLLCVDLGGRRIIKN